MIRTIALWWALASLPASLIVGAICGGRRA